MDPSCLASTIRSAHKCIDEAGVGVASLPSSEEQALFVVSDLEIGCGGFSLQHLEGVPHGVWSRMEERARFSEALVFRSGDGSSGLSFGARRPRP